MSEAANEALEALKKGDVTRVKALLAEHPGLVTARDPHGVSLLLQARYRFQLALADEIAAHHPGIDIFEACALGRVDRVRALLDAAPHEVRTHSPDGYTPLHLAAFFGHPEVAKLLLARGAPVDAVSTNPMELQPLHSATAGPSAEVVDLLLERGADPKARQHGGFTPLHSAAANNNVAMAKSLLARGADPDAACDDGRTARDVAESKENDEILALFTG